MASETENGTDSVENVGEMFGLDSNQIIGAGAGLAGLIGNGLVCFIMLRFRAVFKSVTNRLMLHQSFVDFLLSGMMLFTRLYTPWGEFYCRVPRGWLYWGLAHVSTSSLMLICCDRYVAVCHPIKYRKWFSFKRVKLALVFVWLLPMSWQVYLVFVHLPDGASCIAIWPSDAARLSWGVATFCWEYLVPLSIIFYTFSHTILSLRKRLRAKAIQAASEPSASLATARNTRPIKPKDPLQTAKVKLTITFMVVAIFFVICWGPTEITWLLFNFGVLPGTYYASLWHLGVETPLLCLNTCVNPFIYCLTYTHFRRHVAKVFCCQRCSNNKVGDGSVESQTENSSDPVQSTSRATGKTLQTQVNTLSAE